MTSRRMVDAALGGAGIDRLIAHRDGTFTAKRAFFYRMGCNAEVIAERVLRALPGAVIISCDENWQEWPKTSYFEVKFKLPEGGAANG